MRRQYFYWTYLVLAIVLTIYGGYTLIYHFNHGNKLSVLSLVFLIVGVIMLLIYLVLYLISLKNKRKNIEEVTQENIEPVEEPQDTVIDNPQEVEKEEPIVSGDDNVAPTTDNGVTYERVSYSRYDVDDIYVKKVGYGPVLRVSGNRVLDMRSNTYYHIQGNMVHQDGGGPAFEINGSKIRSAFGGYLYEISGSNINKVFGGFYASISGNYITIHDLSEKYETTGTLNKNQILVVAALLFEA